MNLNTCIFSGRLGKDPELREYGDTQVTKIRMAVNKIKEEDVNWFTFTAFGKNAVNIAKIAHKGDFLTVECRAENNTYEKNGETRYSTEFIVRSWDLVHTKNTNGNSARDEEEEEAQDYGF
jgi:single-strand DNA-binding protein